jgi:hypothetical protein
MEIHRIHPELLERQVRMLVVGCGGTGLSDHPKPAIYDHLKTGHMETHSGTLTTA